MGYTGKLQKVAASVLEPGEDLLAGARAMTSGATASIIGGAAGAVAGGGAGMLIADKLTGDAAKEGRARAERAGVGSAPQVALGLTSRRLLVWKRSGLSGKAKELIGTLPVEEIASVEGEDSGSKLKPDLLTLGLRSGESLTFEIVKADGYGEIVQAFSHLRKGT